MVVKNNVSYNQKQPANETVLDKIVSIVEMLKSVLDGKYKLSMKIKVIGVMGLLYLISPIDLIPDWVTGPIGFADDVAVVALLWKMLQSEVSNYLAMKKDNSYAQYEEIEIKK